MKRLRSYSTDDENSESTSESLSTGLQNGGPTESSLDDSNLPEERELDEQSWEMPPRPSRKEKKWRKYMKRILEEELKSRESKIYSEVQALKEKQEANKSFKRLKEDGLTQEKMETFFINTNAHLEAYNISQDEEKIRFLAGKLEGRSLENFNRIRKEGTSFNELVRRIKEERFGPENKWERMIAITFKGEGSAIEYWTRKVEAIKACDAKASDDLVIEQVIAGMKEWEDYSEIRRHSYRLWGKDKKEDLKKYFIQVASEKKSEKKEVVNAVTEEKKCYLCNKPGHFKRDCPEKKLKPARRCFHCQGDHYSSDCERRRGKSKRFERYSHTDRDRKEDRFREKERDRKDRDSRRYEKGNKVELPNCGNNNLGKGTEETPRHQARDEEAGETSLRTYKKEVKFCEDCLKDNNKSEVETYLSSTTISQRSSVHGKSEEHKKLINTADEVFTIEELKIENSKNNQDDEKEVVINSIENGKKESTSTLLKVGAKIGNQYCEILLDSGAKVNCASKNFVDKLGLKPKSCSKRLVGANNTNLRVIGSVNLRLEFEGSARSVEDDHVSTENENTYFWRNLRKRQRQPVWKKSKSEFEVEIVVVEDLSIPILLGFPTMEEMGVILDTTRGTVSFSNLTKQLEIPYVGKKEEYVYTVEEVVLEPFSARIVKLSTERKLEENTLYTIEEAIGMPGVEIPEGVVDESSKMLLLKNLNNKRYRIKKGLPIGVLKKAIVKEEEEIMTVEETDKEGSQEDLKQEEKDFQEDRKKALSGKGISAKGMKEIGKILRRYQDTFRRKVRYDESKMKITPYKLRMREGAIPVIEPMGRGAPERQEIMSKIIEEIASRGLIEKGKGENRSRVLLIKKSDGTWRTVIDYRKLNTQMIPDSYPMPRIDDMLDNLNGAKYFSKLDMTDGFWQIGLDEESRELTGFATRSQFWRWKVLPMGIMNSPSAFQRAMDQVLGELKWKIVMCYVDDLIIYSNTLEEHLEHIEAVLKKLQEANIYVKLAKCQFGVEEIKFLGHIVGKEGMKPDPEKTKAVKNMDIPKDEKAVSRFLGMAGFYRKYVKNFSARTTHLRELTRKDTKFVWTKECEDEMNDIKDALTKGPVMVYPDWNKKFILSTDASYQGLGATLSQMGPGGEQVIAYASRSLNSHEKNYGVTKLEALGVVWAVELFKVYLQDHPFDLVTDHKALVKFKEMKDTNPTLERWSIKLSAYDFNVIYRQGKKHDNVDCLSRDPVNIVTEEDEATIRLVKAQKEDEILGKIYERVLKKGRLTFGKNEEIEERVLSEKYDAFVIAEDGKLYLRSLRRGEERLRDRLCIPMSYRAATLSQAHNHHHYETKKTYKELKDKVWWNGMYKDCDLYCKSCERCARRNSPKGKQKGIIKMMDVTRKFELIGIDLMTPGPRSKDGNEHVMVVTDYATKWSSAIPIKDKTSKTVADTLWEHWICTFGLPERIISDNGGEFTADELKNALIKVSQVKQHLITPYNPRANGQVERFNKTLANRLAKFTGEHQDTWDKYVATVCMDYNTTKHSSTGETPYFLLYGQEPTTGLDRLVGRVRQEVYDIERWRNEDVPAMMTRMKYAQENRRKKQAESAEKKNGDKENVLYILGEKVWVREEPRTDVDKATHKKLRLPWIGPFEISKANTKEYGNSYQVKRMIEEREDIRVVNVKNLKKYHERPEWMKTEDEVLPEAARNS